LASKGKLVGSLVGSTNTFLHSLVTTPLPAPLDNTFAEQCAWYPCVGPIQTNGIRFAQTYSFTADEATTIRAWLDYVPGPAGKKFQQNSLALRKLSGSTWSTVASNADASGNKYLQYDGTAGQYQIVVTPLAAATMTYSLAYKF